MILIAYDGSDDARAAIDRAGALLPGADATVLTVWEPFHEIAVQHGAGLGWGGYVQDYTELDRAAQDAANERAGEGAERAGAAGLRAQTRIECRLGSTSDAIIRVADDLDADVIVMGTRGLTGLRSLILGSVSHGVAQRGDRPLLIVPSSATAERRAASLEPPDAA